LFTGVWVDLLADTENGNNGNNGAKESIDVFQKIKEIRLDCDGDTLLLMVEQIGGVACHTGRAHCFYKKWHNNEWQEVDAVLKNPSEIYKKG
jgi:phosphoribosyl-AMP cyclohydrolase